MNPTCEEIEAKIALLEVQLKLSEAAERAWESSMMQACGEDGPKSVADKFAELESKLETALRESRSAGITIDNLEAKCAALAAENAGLKAAIETHKHGFVRCNCCGDELMCHTDDVCRALDDTPATDAFLAEVRAQERTDFIGRIEWIIRNECNPDKTETILNELQSFSDQLRKGGNQ